MSAYVVFIRERVTDPDALAAYSEQARAARGDHPLSVLAAYGALDTLEGEPADGLLILEFPTMDAARAWYGSDAYQQAKSTRQLGADYRVLLVEGMD